VPIVSAHFSFLYRGMLAKRRRQNCCPDLHVFLFYSPTGTEKLRDRYQLHSDKGSDYGEKCKYSYTSLFYINRLGSKLFEWPLYVENLVADRRNRFINRYGETDNILYVKCCADWFVCLTVFLFIAFV